MAAGAWKFFGRAKEVLATAGINFSGNTFIVTLHASGTLFSAGHDITTLASASALCAQLASSNGYDKGGQTLSGTGVRISSNNVEFSRAGACWSANGGNLGGASSIKMALIRTAASANAEGQPICFSTLSTTAFAVADTNALKLNGGRGSTAVIFTLS